MTKRNENNSKKEVLYESESEDHFSINDRTHSENDNKYEPMTNDLDKIVMSTPMKHTTIKKQTKIINTFHLTKKEVETIQQNNKDKRIIYGRRQK